MDVSLSPEATTLYEALPEDGSKLSGRQIKETVELSVEAVRQAKKELRAEGLVVVGRGRGGTVRRTEGVKVDLSKTTPQERMAHARAARQANTAEKRQRDAFRDRALAAARKLFPDRQILERDVSLYGQDEMIVSVPDAEGKGQQNYLYVDEEE